MTILAIEASTKTADHYLLFDDTGSLWLSNAAGTDMRHIAKLSSITSLDKPIEMTLHEPYACVVERFGVHGAVVDLRDSAIREIQRTDYHADVSSYSHAFLERDGACLLIHQTAWNRLDIMDLATGHCLTERSIVYHHKPEQRDANGVITSPAVDKSENYLDFFHSRLHVSPHSKYFLSNGWMWSPVDNILAYELANFFRAFDPAGAFTEFHGGYNWDRPCTFIDDETFAVIVDDTDDDERDASGYLPLWMYRVSEVQDRERYRYIEAFRKLPCDAFGLNGYREVHGELYYDPTLNCLIAISDKGGFQIGLDGSTLRHDPDVARMDRHSHTDLGSHYAFTEMDWKYSVRSQCFYRFNQERRIIERRNFDGSR